MSEMQKPILSKKLLARLKRAKKRIERGHGVNPDLDQMKQDIMRASFNEDLVVQYEDGSREPIKVSFADSELNRILENDHAFQ